VNIDPPRDLFYCFGALVILAVLSTNSTIFIEGKEAIFGERMGPRLVRFRSVR